MELFARESRLCSSSFAEIEITEPESSIEWYVRIADLALAIALYRQSAEGGQDESAHSYAEGNSIVEVVEEMKRNGCQGKQPPTLSGQKNVKLVIQNHDRQSKNGKH